MERLQEIATRLKELRKAKTDTVSNVARCDTNLAEASSEDDDARREAKNKLAASRNERDSIAKEITALEGEETQLRRDLDNSGADADAAGGSSKKDDDDDADGPNDGAAPGSKNNGGGDEMDTSDGGDGNPSNENGQTDPNGSQAPGGNTDSAEPDSMGTDDYEPPPQDPLLPLTTQKQSGFGFGGDHTTTKPFSATESGRSNPYLFGTTGSASSPARIQQPPAVGTLFAPKSISDRLTAAKQGVKDIDVKIRALTDKISMLDTQLNRSTVALTSRPALDKAKSKAEDEQRKLLEELKAKNGEVERLENEKRIEDLSRVQRDLADSAADPRDISAHEDSVP